MTRAPRPRRRGPRRPSGRVSLADMLRMTPGDLLVDNLELRWVKVGRTTWSCIDTDRGSFSDVRLMSEYGPLRRAQ